MSFVAADCALAEIVWSDEFNGPVIDNSVWTYDVGNQGFGNGELQYHTARWENARIENGNLVIEARRENYKGSNNSFTSARLKTHGRFAFKYGTLEARIKVPNLANGLWPAFWMLGDNFGQVGWPDCGEVDILEMGMKSAITAGQANRRVHAGAFWDYQNQSADYGLDWTAAADLNTDYHLYKLVWTPAAMTVYVDDTQVWAFDISNIEEPSLEEFHRPMFILTNLSVGGYNFVEITNPALITAPFPAKMYIDWIRLNGNPDTVLYFGDDAAETGTFGVYTETTPVNDQLVYDTDTKIYFWNNLTPRSTAPYEGTDAMSYDAAAGAWFGMGIFCLENRNMKNYSDGYLHVHIKTTTPAPFRIGIASSAAGESWLPFVSGGEEFGLVRDGNWHEVQIPLNRFANIDFRTIKQIFMLAGDAPAASLNISLDNIYWTVSVERSTPANGSFGVFTETASHKDTGQFNLGTDGQFYVWADTLSPKPQSPYEGTGSIALGSTPGPTWFGAAFTPNVKYNLTAFRYPESRLRFAMKTSSTVAFMIGIKSGNVEDIGQKWIPFSSGNDPYGFVRDGNWHVVEIPMTDIADDVDLSQVSQLFEILGVNGPITSIELDDICFTGGGAPLSGGNLAPSIGFSSPSDGQLFSVGSDITIEASAEDTDGSVTKVEFFEGTNLLGEDLTEPYTVIWKNVPAGAYMLTAKATDDKGAFRTASIRVYVGQPVLTGITISPSTATVEVGQTLQLTAAGSDQFGLPLAISPNWSVTGGGSIDSAGLFSAVFPGGPFTVTAQEGALSATAAVTVTKPQGGCTGGPVSGDYTYIVSGASENPTISFIPGYAGVGSGIVILYYGTTPGGVYPGHVTSPNTPVTITAAHGQTVYFYYTYSIPEGGERNTANNRHSVVVGDCAVSVPGDLNGDGSVGINDLLMIAFYWLETTCDSQNEFCFGADIQPDGIVNLEDLAFIAGFWLN